MARILLVLASLVLALAIAPASAQAQGYSISSVQASSVTSTSATVTVTLSGSATDTIYFRHRTGSGVWTTASAAASSGVATFTLAGLTPSTEYAVEASLAADYSSPSTTTFTTARRGPAFALQVYSRTVSELAPAGTEVGPPVTATVEAGYSLTYTLVGSQDFEIRTSTGQIIVAAGAVIDYEAKDSYDLTVTASDGSLSASVPVSVLVTDVPEAGLFGAVTIEVGVSGTRAGYSAGSPSFGVQVSGTFPGALFQDGQARDVAGIYEDANDWTWSLVYSGGDADGWHDAASLGNVEMRVVKESTVDTRRFVLSGFSSASGSTLTITPPYQGPEWAAENGLDLRVEFHHRRTIAPATPEPAPRPEPDGGGRRSIAEWVADTTPGGGFIAQLLVTLAVYSAVLWSAPDTPRGVLWAAGALAIIPLLPVAMGFGEGMGAALNLLNMALGGFVYKSMFARAAP